MMWGYGMGWWGWMGMALFWILVILAIVWLARYLDGGRGEGGRGNGGSRHDAMEILRERYARSEIDAEEFERRKRDLEG